MVNYMIIYENVHASTPVIILCKLIQKICGSLYWGLINPAHGKRICKKIRS